MDRDALIDLDAWLERPARQPLVIRGARQVGKTWLVREFARRAEKRLVEMNFERDPGFSRFFDEADPQKVLRAIEAQAAVPAAVHGRSAAQDPGWLAAASRRGHYLDVREAA